MHYYVIFFCNWTSQSNAVVKSVELTTANPLSFVTETNPYVFVDLTKHLSMIGTKPFGTTVDEIMTNFVNKVGGLSINDVPISSTEIAMGKVRISDRTPPTRKLTDWNDVAKPALQRLANTSSFGTL